jgi:hypothetical protein
VPRSLPGTNYGVRGACASDLIEYEGVINATDDSAVALEPFFAQVFEQAWAGLNTVTGGLPAFSISPHVNLGNKHLPLLAGFTRGPLNL